MDELRATLENPTNAWSVDKEDKETAERQKVLYCWCSMNLEVKAKLYSENMA